MNARTDSRPAVFHFNGGGKKHHLAVEARAWWKACAEANTPGALDALRRTTLRFGGRERAFADVCPGHVEAHRDEARERACGASALMDLD